MLCLCLILHLAVSHAPIFAYLGAHAHAGSAFNQLLTSVCSENDITYPTVNGDQKICSENAWFVCHAVASTVLMCCFSMTVPLYGSMYVRLRATIISF